MCARWCAIRYYEAGEGGGGRGGEAGGVCQSTNWS